MARPLRETPQEAKGAEPATGSYSRAPTGSRRDGAKAWAQSRTQDSPDRGHSSTSSRYRRQGLTNQQPRHNLARPSAAPPGRRTPRPEFPAPPTEASAGSRSAARSPPAVNAVHPRLALFPSARNLSCKLTWLGRPLAPGYRLVGARGANRKGSISFRGRGPPGRGSCRPFKPAQCLVRTNSRPPFPCPRFVRPLLVPELSPRYPLTPPSLR